MAEVPKSGLGLGGIRILAILYGANGLVITTFVWCNRAM